MMRRVPNRSRFLNNPSQAECTGVLLGQGEELRRLQLGFGVFGMSSLQGVREKQGKRREITAAVMADRRDWGGGGDFSEEST
ncbi:hypothetical protein Taro_029522 [Colocasia esculenta]|uniref:Uncharacterized protein n=1 Tax=Colocasia esculenta TaxID=4460 RepID=A0A843VRE3_COLES|nr:hypothetical protein [Colocasia esculenta]